MCVYGCMFKCMHLCMSVFVCVHVRVFMHVHVCVCVCVCVCVLNIFSNQSLFRKLHVRSRWMTQRKSLSTLERNNCL